MKLHYNFTNNNKEYIVKIYIVPRLNAIDLDDNGLSFLKEFAEEATCDDVVIFRDALLTTGSQELYRDVLFPIVNKCECYYFGDDGNFFVLGGRMNPIEGDRIEIGGKIIYLNNEGLIGDRYKLNDKVVKECGSNEYFVCYGSKARIVKGNVISVGSLSCKRKNDCDNVKGVTVIQSDGKISCYENKISQKYYLFVKRSGSDTFDNPTYGKLNYEEFLSASENDNVKFYLDVLDETYELPSGDSERVTVSVTKNDESDESFEEDLMKFVEGKLAESEFTLFKRYYEEAEA